MEQVDALVHQTKRLGADHKLHLRIGYLRCYSGMELHQAVAEFSKAYPEVSIDIVNGTHEELYDLLRFGKVEIILSDQRRAFSEAYVNSELMQCGCFAEISLYRSLGQNGRVSLEKLKLIPFILVPSREQQVAEQKYHQNIFGVGSSNLFADNLEGGRLFAAGNRGLLSLENIEALPRVRASIQRLPIYRGNKQITRNYCAFWRKDQTNGDIEAFEEILRKLSKPENNCPLPFPSFQTSSQLSPKRAGISASQIV